MALSVKERIKVLKECALADPEYARLSKEAVILESEFELALLDLPEEIQDTVWKYLFHCEAQSERLLELSMTR